MYINTEMTVLLITLKKCQNKLLLDSKIGDLLREFRMVLEEEEKVE